VVGLYDDRHVLIEGDEEAQKALHRELAEVAAQHLTAGAEAGSFFVGGRAARLKSFPSRFCFGAGSEIKIPRD